MKKKYLYGIIIILLLCVCGFISIPFLQNNNFCDINNKGKVYFHIFGITLPIEFNNCSKE